MKFMGYKIKVDRELCIGAANCVGIAGNVFKIDAENKAVVISEKGDPDDTIMSAAEACPTKAIILVDEETGEQVYP